MGAAAIPYIIMAAGTAASVYNTRQTAKRQDNQLAAQLRGQANKQREADAKTGELIRAQAGSTDADERAGSLAEFTKQVQAHKASAEKPLQTQGAVSEAYKKAGSNAALGMGDYAGQISNLLASIDAPRQQRQNDALVTGRYATDIDQIKRFSAGDDFLAEMRLRNIRRNPWIDAASSMASGYASGYGGGG